MRYKTSALADFCKTGSGGTPSRKELAYYDGGTIPWVKSGELRENIIFETEEHVTELAVKKTSVKMAPKGAILLAMYGATVGRLAILGIDATTNQAICHIVPDERIADRGYLYHCLQHKVPELLSKAIGGAQPNINQQIIKRMQIPLPPLAEQQRIAAILDQADMLRTKRRAALAKLDTLLQATFLDMFGDPVTNPMGWETMQFGDVGSLERGKSKHRPRNAPELLGGSYPLVQTGDVSNAEGGYLTDYTQTYSELGLKQSRLWKSGVLCITIAANIANTAILTFDACFPDSVVGFLPNNHVRTEYVQYWLGFLQKIIEEEAPQVAQKNINLKILRELEIPVPPINLQDEFVQVAKTQINLRDFHKKHMNQVDNLFHALQQRAFKGQL